MVVAAPGPPDFQLHTLGWRAFQDLAGVVLREVLGQSFQTFADSNDGGRDGAFYGRWRTQNNLIEVPVGPFVLQCKHSARAESTLTHSSLKDEFDKVARLVRRNLCKTYILLTNARLTASSEEKIRSTLQGLGVEHPLVFGAEWLNQTIARNGTLRMLVPRVYGLGDLSQILDERAYNQGAALLSYLSDDLASMVVTEAYRKAAKAVSTHGFVLLLGEPAVGKSLIAATLAMTALDNWKCLTLKAESPIEVVDHWNPHEPNQFIWVDDAFGSLRHDRALTDEWVRRLPKIMAAIKGGAKIVLTSRDYIYREARRYLKEYEYPLLQEQRVTVQVESLNQDERRQILYNHIRLGNQSAQIRKTLKPNLDKVAEITPFRPEVARRLGRKEFTVGMSFQLHEIVHFMKHPTSFLRDVYSGLDAAHQAALMLVQSAGLLSSSLDLSEAQLSTLNSFGVTRVSVSDALRTLEGTFLRTTLTPGSPDKSGWSFRHPTLREGFAAYVDEDVHRVGVFLSSLRDEELLAQIDCGNGTEQGTLVLVPPVLYHQVAERLASLKPKSYDDPAEYTNWYDFFTTKASVNFLQAYIAVDPQFVDSLINFKSYSSNMPQAKLLARLNEYGFLLPKHRMAALIELRELATERPESSWLDQLEWRAILGWHYPDVLHYVKDILLPNLASTINSWSLRRPSDENPYSYYLPLEDALARYRQEFINDPECVDIIDESLYLIADTADSEYEDYLSETTEPEFLDYDYENETETSLDERLSYPSSLKTERSHATQSDIANSVDKRSIFDDIDS